MPTTGTIPLVTQIPGNLISSSLWNGEFSNVGTLLDATGTGGYSVSDGQMQIQTDPYPSGVISRASSISGELERIRYVLAQILGKTYWYLPADSGNSLASVFVTGEIRLFGGSSIPTGFLECDGSAVSRTTYAALYAVVGTTWGSGNGSTTFNVPDLRGRAPIGAGTGSGLTARSLGATGGEETHIISAAEMPTHNHTVTDPGHTHTVTDPGHNHNERTGVGGGSQNAPVNSSAASGVIASDFGTGSNTTGVTNQSSVTGISTQNAGSGSAHNNMQPFAVCKYMIKT